MQTNVQIDSKNLSSNDHLKRGGKYNTEVSIGLIVQILSTLFLTCDTTIFDRLPLLILINISSSYKRLIACWLAIRYTYATILMYQKNIQFNDKLMLRRFVKVRAS